jgi:hypothetical protein
MTLIYAVIERVARAICLAGVIPDDIRTECDSICGMCRDEARAAIAAMREPTEAMLGTAFHGHMESDEARDIYQAMIDEALRDD